MILFLDFDGVLHKPVTYKKEEQFVRVPLLEATLRRVPEVDIVISSSWRLQRSLSELRGEFSADIAAKIIDVTPHGVDPSPALWRYPRHAEIDAWLRAQKRLNEPWVALDDRADWFMPRCLQLIYCKPGRMLDKETAALLFRRLRNRCALAPGAQESKK